MNKLKEALNHSLELLWNIFDFRMAVSFSKGMFMSQFGICCGVFEVNILDL